jgi:hypothetical protein
MIRALKVWLVWLFPVVYCPLYCLLFHYSVVLIIDTGSLVYLYACSFVAGFVVVAVVGRGYQCAV